MLSVAAVGVTAQSSVTRNEQVTSLNAIIAYMDETSRIQQQVYFDILSFADAYYTNLRRPAPNAWHVMVKPGARLRSGDFHLYKELKPDAEGYIDDYQSRMLPLYRTKKALQEQLEKYPVNNEAVNDAFVDFRRCFDSLEFHYRAMVAYVNTGKFKNDTLLTYAGGLLDTLQLWFDRYNESTRNLYSRMEQYYQTALPPLPAQKTILAAEQELLLSVTLLERWAAQLRNDDDMHRMINDSLLRDLYKQGQSREEAYLSGTYGYGRLNNGAYPHSRYHSFYQHMPSTIFWFRSDTVQQHKYMPAAYENYNKFVNRYNQVIHYYNRFIECADGHAHAYNMDYSPAMAAQLGVDTTRNVLLKKPRIAYRFAIAASVEQARPIAGTTTDTVTERRQAMIQAASPHHTVYLLDVSNSMKEDQKLDTLQQAMKYLVGLQRAVDHISMIAFASEVQVLIHFKPCNEKEDIYRAINNLKPGGGTNAEAAVQHGYSLTDSTLRYKGKTKLVIVTDGQFTLERKTKKKIEQYHKKGISLSIVLLGRVHDAGTIDYFRRLTRQGAGNFYEMNGHLLEEVLVKEASD